MKKRIINILMIICLITALSCGGYLAYYYYTSNKSENNVSELRNKIQDDTEEETQEEEAGKKGPEMVLVDGVYVQKKFEDLYKSNHDFVGWIRIKDTNVDYPVMYTPDDSEGGEHYIHKDFEENYSAAGLPFIDMNCDLILPTDNIIVYGHNMNSGKMFHDIIQYDNEEFYNSHKTFTFDTIYGDGVYEVVAMFYSQIYPEDSDQFKYYQFVNAGDKKEFMDYVDNIKRLSVRDTGVDVQYGDKLITLSTCAYHVKDGRFAVVARKVEED